MDLFKTKAEKRLLPGGADLFYLGTSGYSFPHWLNVFYPSRIARKDWLRFYALKFNPVEINSTYYRILSESSADRMSDSVPDNFSFSVKLHSPMTHSPDATGDGWAAFDRMLAPLVSSGRMGIVLAQFPWSFTLEKESFTYLRLHGRNSGKWWGNTQERYDYLYSDREISTWAYKLRSLSKEVKKCYVFFNNCYMGKAALNAADIQRLMGV